MPLLLLLLPLLQTPGGLGNGTLLHRINSDPRAFAPEQAVLIGDVDGDGAGDFVAASPHSVGRRQLLQLISGATGEILWKRDGDSDRFQLNGPVIAFPDLDGDGLGEFIAGDANLNPSGIHLRSGATGTLIWKATGDRFGSLGASLSILDDFDGDGIPEVLAGEPLLTIGTSLKTGRVRIYSGADGSLLRSWDGTQPKGRFGTAVAGLGDLNADGFPEALVSAVPGPNQNLPGEVQMISTADGSVLRTWTGGSATERFGEVLAGFSDLDGDGLADFAVGHSRSSPGGLLEAGSVTCYSGRTGTVLYTLHGSQDFMEFGASIGDAGDVDADGVPDLLIGAPGLNVAGMLAVGAVQLHSGRTGLLILSVQGDDGGTRLGSSTAPFEDLDGDGMPDFAALGSAQAGIRFHSSATGAELSRMENRERTEGLGALCSAAGDLDGDGVPDYAVYSPGAERDHSALRFHSGADHRVLREIEFPWVSGDSARLVGGLDFDRDGVPDLLLGAPSLAPPPPLTNGSGQVHLYSGATGLLIRQFVPSRELFRLGRSLTTLEDLDGDGIPEVLAGGMGSVFLFSGGTGAELLRLDAPSIRDFGAALAAVDDLDGDGRQDFAVGDPRLVPKGSNIRHGGVLFYSSSSGAFQGVSYGKSPWDAFGSSLALVGDLDHDGVQDLVVGDPEADSIRLYDSGVISAISGRTGNVLWRHSGSFDDHHLGETLAALGDVDGDGIPDLVSGSPSANSFLGAHGPGRIDVRSGKDGRLLEFFEGNEDWQGLGHALAGPGDLDGDGLGELLFGNPRFNLGSIEDAGKAEVWTWTAPHPYLAPVELVAGQTAELRVYGARGSTVGFGLSLVGPGPTWIPQLGLALELSQPLHLIGQAAPNANGQAAISGIVPAAWLGRTVWLQAVDAQAGGALATNPLRSIVR